MPEDKDKKTVSAEQNAPVKKQKSQGEDIGKKIQDYFDYLQVVYAERGFEPFKIPVLVVLGITFSLYFFLYTPIEPKISDLQSKLDTQKTISESLGEYNDAKNTITEYKKKLPMYKDREDWLNYLIISTAKELGIEIESLSPQQITEEGKFAIASRNVETTLMFEDAGKWIEKLENAPVFIRITNASINKIQEDPAYVKLTMSISTVFLKD